MKISLKRKNRRLGEKTTPNFWLVYTIVFAVVFAAMYSYFFFSGKLLLWYSDGFQQHMPSLMYLGVWLRDMLKNLFFNHSLNIATYSFGLGYGGDIVQILHYYVIGDPLNLLSVFVPSSKTFELFQFLIVLRLYLAGLAFAKMCFYFNDKRSDLAVLSGTLIYIFGGYAMFTGTRHPYFLNPLIYMPIVILGAEKIRRKEKPFVFVLGVAVSALSNFYFFFMIVIFTVGYVVLKLIFDRKGMEAKDIALYLLKLACYAVLGVVMAGIILLPVIIQVLLDPRASSDSVYDLIYNREYYEGLLNTFVSFTTRNREWLHLGLTGIALISLYALFKKRKERTMLKVGFIIMTVLLFIPTAAYLLNAMSYVANRWTWIYSMLICYVIVDTADDVVAFEKRDFIRCGAFILVYAALCAIINASLTDSAVTQLLIALFVLFALLAVSASTDALPKLKGKVKFLKGYKIGEKIVAAGAIAALLLNAFFVYDPQRSDFLNQYSEAQRHLAYFNVNEASIINQKYKDEGFSRYSGQKLLRNASLNNHQSSTQYYFSLSNPNILEFFKEMDLDIIMGQSYDNLDNRASLTTLANVKYYATDEAKDKKHRPYGFTGLKTWYCDNYGHIIPEKNAAGLDYRDILKTYYIYKNSNFLPFGYTYSSYVPRSEYENMNSLQKQETMLQSVVLDNDSSILAKGNPIFTGKEIKYTFKPQSYSVSLQNGPRFVSTLKKTKVDLLFNGLPESETYVYIKGLKFKGTKEADLYNDDREIDPYNFYNEKSWGNLSEMKRDKIQYESDRYDEPHVFEMNVKSESPQKHFSNTFKYATQRYSWYQGRCDFLLNLNYEKAAKTKATITLPQRGTFYFDEIKVYCQPINKVNYEDRVRKLSEDCLKNVDFHTYNNSAATNEITGEIDLKENKFLLLSVPYSDAWTAYVDGKKTKLLRANTMFSGLELTSGHHEIRLEYDTPCLKLGILMSAAGSAVFIGLVVVYIVLRKRRIKKESK